MPFDPLLLAVFVAVLLIASVVWYSYQKRQERTLLDYQQHQHTASAHEPDSDRVDASGLEEVERLIKADQKSEAVKLYRALTGVGLNEAKEAIGAIEMGLPAAALAPAVQTPRPDAELEQEIQHLLAENKAISAIKLYRERTGAGLKEAKDVIDRMRMGMAFEAIASPSEAPVDHQSLEDEVRDLLAQGHKISAIKLYRERTGRGLKESREAVERLDQS